LADSAILRADFIRLAMRFPFLLLLVLCGAPRVLLADPPRTALKGPPIISGREILEFAVVAPIHVGENLPPGLPTTITYEIRPNRFKPLSEDVDGIYYQCAGSFQNMVANATLGGLYVTKRSPILISPYTGDASYPRVPLSLDAPLSGTDLSKIKFRFGRTIKKN
jgi:hypothetical protein